MTDPAPSPDVAAKADAHAADSPDFVPAFILRNQGVPVALYRLDPETGERMMMGEGEDATPVTKTMHLRFDSNAVADIEDAFDGLRAFVPIIRRVPLTNPDGSVRVVDGKVLETEVEAGEEERTFYGLEGFQKAMEIRTSSTVRKAMAIAFGVTPQEMGRQMIDGQSIEYQNAVGVAWSMAQGVDPTEAAKVLNRARAAVADARRSMASELEKTMDEALASTTDSPGNPG